MSLVKKAIILQGDNKNDYELDIFLKSYIEKKHLNLKKKTQKGELRMTKEYQILAIQVDNKLVAIKNIADSAYYIEKKLYTKLYQRRTRELSNKEKIKIKSK
ncbi:20715_t:CDS:1, partial [Racocetra persica]